MYFRISSAALRLYARIFKSAPPNLIGEVYLSLASQIISTFAASSLCPTRPEGLDLKDRRVILVLRKASRKTTYEMHFAGESLKKKKKKTKNGADVFIPCYNVLFLVPLAEPIPVRAALALVSLQ
jgi:hypothetical protein